jgi:hypothetical protein
MQREDFRSMPSRDGARQGFAGKLCAQRWRTRLLASRSNMSGSENGPGGFRADPLNLRLNLPLCDRVIS